MDIHYSTGKNPSENDWVEISSGEANVDSLEWTPNAVSDSVRVRVRDPNSYDEEKGKYIAEDISGWYFSVSSGRAAKLAGSRSIGKGFNR